MSSSACRSANISSRHEGSLKFITRSNSCSAWSHASVGLSLGDVDGDALGRALGLSLGDDEGDTLGCALGFSLGDDDGDPLGRTLGLSLGDDDGDSLGRVLGRALGCALGLPLGDALGLSLGDDDTGDAVGASVMLQVISSSW